MNRLRLSGIDRGDECELLVFVDSLDVLGSLDAVGVDPDVALAQMAATSRGHRMELGRCGCGDPSCGSVSVRITDTGEAVVWDEWETSFGFEVPDTFSFDRDLYAGELERADRDRAWESGERSFARSVAALIDDYVKAALEWRGLIFEDVAPAGDGAIVVRFRAEVAGARWSIYAVFPVSSDPERVRNFMVRRGPTSWPAVAWWGENEAAAFVQPPMAGKRWRMWEPSSA